MEPAVYDTTTADFDVRGKNSAHVYRFRATGSVVKFEGFTRLYLEAAESGDHRRLDDLEPLPVLDVGDRFSWNGGAGAVGVVQQVEPKQHFTQPPPRYSEASLVKALEEQGIGRPSTYAQIISTLQDRSYVETEDRRFHPTGLGEVVVKLLVKVFPDIFEVAFTSQMEEQLDQVEEGDVDWQQLLGRFYPRLRELLAAGEGRSDEIVREILAAEGETCDLCGRPMQVRFNKFGSFLGCSGYPECKSTRSLDQDRPEEKHLGVDPANGQPVSLKEGPYGPYVERSAADEGQKPSRTSLPAGRKPADVDLAYSLRLLSLPRSLGLDPSSSEEVVAGLGRYGPYVRRGKTFANLRSEDELFGVGLEEALTRLAQKQSGKSVLRELGPHPESGNDVQVLSGRYGPYVSDGEVNATIPKTWDPLEVGMEEAVDLLRERAAKGGGKGRRRQRVAVGRAKKATKKGAKKAIPEDDAEGE